MQIVKRLTVREFDGVVKSNLLGDLFYYEEESSIMDVNLVFDTVVVNLHPAMITFRNCDSTMTLGAVKQVLLDSNTGVLRVICDCNGLIEKTNAFNFKISKKHY